MADATNAPGVKQGAGQPVIPGDAAKKVGDGGKAAAEADQAAPGFTGSGAPPKDAEPEEPRSTFGKDDLDTLPLGTEPADDQGAEEEDYVREEPKPVNHGVVQDNVSEPGVQSTHYPDGSESVHDPAAIAEEKAAEAEALEAAEPDVADD
jgi:hypothetical protein